MNSPKHTIIYSSRLNTQCTVQFADFESIYCCLATKAKSAFGGGLIGGVA